MSEEIRILKTWGDVDQSVKDDLFRIRSIGFNDYMQIMNVCTRPITPEDIRVALRMVDEWTEADNIEFAKHECDYMAGKINSGQFAQYAIDIATRTAPADPWDEMDAVLSKSYTCQDTVHDAWAALKKAEGRE